MTQAVSVTAAKIEITTVTLPVEAFEAEAADDFERLRARAESAREEYDRTAGRRAAGRTEEELREARRELEEGLRSRRQRIDEELDKARERAAERAGNSEGDSSAERGFGSAGAGERVVRHAMMVVGSGTPYGFQSGLRTGLMASGDPAGALRGWRLTGGGTSADLLKETLESLGGLGSRFSLDSEGLGALRGILADSGVSGERIDELMAEFAAGPQSLDRVLLILGKAGSDIARAAGVEQDAAGLELLTATSDGLTSLGQYLMSLGLSSETVKGVTSGISDGETLSSADLGNLLAASGAEALAPLLSDGDLSSLTAALKSMGLDQKGLDSLSSLLSQGSSDLGDLLGLLAHLEKPEPLSVDPAKAAADVQKLLESTSRDGRLVRAPLFNEIVLRLASLGDRELSDDFASLSPALQALRGGLTPIRENGGFDSGAGGQGGRGGDGADRRTASSSWIAPRDGAASPFQSALADEALGYSSSASLARQLEQKLVYSARNGVHRLRINLSPESLGRLDVDLKVEGDRLTAFITAESEEAYAALEKEMGALKQALSEQGLELVMTLSWDGAGDGRRAFAGWGRAAGGSSPDGGGSGDPEGDGVSGAGDLGGGDRLLDAVV